MREIFKLVGTITLDGLEGVKKGLDAIDKQSAIAAKTFNKLGKDVSDIGTIFTKLVSGPITALVGTMALAAGKAGEYADRLGDLVEITGMSSGTLQEMENVARHAGVSFEGFVTSIAKFSNSLPEIIKGTGPAATAIKTLGVNIYDSSGNIKNMNILFPQMLAKLREVENVTQRNALAQDVFDRSLQDIAPVLGLTTQQFEAARKEAHDLGLVMSEDALEAADNYRVEMEKLKAQFTAFVRTLATTFIPVLKDDILPLIQNSIVPAAQKFADKIRIVTEWFRNLDPAAKDAIVKMGALFAVLGPGLIIVGKLISEMKTLTSVIALVRGATLLLTAATLANPFVAGAIAVTAFVGVLYGATKAYQSVIKEHQKYTLITKDQAYKDAFVAGVNELINKIRQYGDAVKDESKLDELLGKEIESLTEQARALGYMVEGNNEKKIQSLNIISQEIQHVKTATGEYVKYNAEINKGSPQKKNLTEAEIKQLQEFQKKREEINQEYENKLAGQALNEITMLNRKENIELANARKFGADEKQITDYYEKERKKILEEDTRNVSEKAKEKAEARKEFETQYSNSLLEQTGKHIQVLENEKQEALKKADELGASKKDILTYYNNLISEENTEKAKEEAETIAKNFKEKMNTVVQSFQQFGSAVGGIFSELSNNQQIETDNWYNKEKLAIESSTRNEEEKKRAIENLDVEADKKRTELKRKQAIKDKEGALFNAAINIAEAITKAFAAGPLIGQVFQGIIAALGAIQMALIAARPIPFAQGALVRGGRGGVQAEIGEGNEDEIVMPLKTGIASIVDGLVTKLSAITIPQFAPAFAGAGNIGYAATTSYPENTRPIEHHWHIGTLIADDRGIKELERRQVKYRVSENQRKGGE
jgi:hypothetical protein